MTVSPGIPVVDITDFNQQTADALVEAASTMGFVMIEGAGFSQKEVDEAFALVCYTLSELSVALAQLTRRLV